MPQKVFIGDEITAPAARIGELRDEYMKRYSEDARQRGMTLEGAWRSPPIDIPGRDATLHVLWSVPSPEAWWAMRLADIETKSLWWEYVDSIAIHRKRIVMTNALTGDGDA